MSRFAIAIIGGVEGGEFSLCSAGRCTLPIEWNASAAIVAEQVAKLGSEVISYAGGPLPDQMEIEVENDDLTANEINSLSGDAYFGGAGIAVVVSQLD